MRWPGHAHNPATPTGFTSDNPSALDALFASGQLARTFDRETRDEAGLHRCNAMVFWSGKPIDTDEEKAAEMLAAIVHAHHQIYGTWPEPTQVRAALVGLNIPVKDQQ